MQYNEFINKIVDSEIEQWTYDDDLGNYVFKNDISITMKQDRIGDEYEVFYEKWVENFAHHPTATKMKVYLCFNGNIVDTFYTVSVDEARMYIPYTKSALELTITYEKYKIGRLINYANCDVIDRYDEYLKQAGIKVLEK